MMGSGSLLSERLRPCPNTRPAFCIRQRRSRGTPVLRSYSNQGPAAREPIRDSTTEVRETIRDTARDARETLRDTRETLEDTTREARETLRDTTREARETLRDTAKEARETLRDTAKEARETARETSGNILEAFYWGRAFAQVLGERANAALTEFLSELGQRDAEQRQAIREFQEEVQARVRQEIQYASTSQPVNTTSNPFFNQRQAPAVELVKIPEVDIQEVVDELRAEIASARSTIQAYKLKTGGSARPAAGARPAGNVGTVSSVRPAGNVGTVGSVRPAGSSGTTRPAGGARPAGGSRPPRGTTPSRGTTK